MEKVIKIGKVPVRLNSNIGWVRAYNNQFGHDILPTLMPLVATILDLAGALVDKAGSEGMTTEALLEAIDSEKMVDALIHASGFEAVEVSNITWALAKCADPEIAAPEEWERQFDVFPLDVILPAIWKLILESSVSSKNRQRLEQIREKFQPKKETKNQ